jgi:pyrimidine operon attenuation protein/uracil phosphoribosyltransferase
MKKTGMKTLLDGKGVERVLSRLTHEIIEKNKGAGQIVLVGIASGGIPLSQVIRGKIQMIEGWTSPRGSSTSPSTGTTWPARDTRRA